MSDILKILIIEDAEDDALLEVREIERHGYKVVWERVQTAEDTSAALDRNAWDVVLSDFLMPGFNAVEALALVRDRDVVIPFIVVSGTYGEEVAVSVIKSGANDFILKRDVSRLVHAIERELREAAGRREQRARIEQMQSEQSSTMQRMRESEERFRSMVETCFDALVTLDLDGRVIYASPSVEALSGYTAEEITGKYLQDITSPADLARVVEAFRSAASREQRGVRLRALRKDGHERLIEVNASPLRRGGEVVAIQTVARDVSEQARAEEQIREAEKMGVVERIAGGIAHEFNNLLTTVIGYSELLTGALAQREELRGQVEEIRKAGERAALLTRQLLAFARKQPLQATAFDLNSIVNHAGRTLRKLAGDRLELRVQLDPDIGLVLADAGQVEYAIMTLAVNARDAMPDGGVLTVATGSADLPEPIMAGRRLIESGSYVVLTVADTGIGMSPEVQSHLFEPFFTSKGLGSGTGMGLASVLGIISQSGGNILVDTEPGKGTAFKILLPRATAVEAAAPRAPSAVSIDTGIRTILIAEDEPMVRRLTERVLRQDGYVVLAAGSGREALEIAGKHNGQIDLLLADVLMPGMRGTELARTIAELRPGIKILYVSGYAERPPSGEGAAGDHSFLEKPFTPGTLLRKVGELLGDAEG